MMVKVLLLAALATVLVSAEDTVKFQKLVIYGPFEIIDMPKLWKMYKTSFNKNYTPVEDKMRCKMFEKSVKSVVELNMKSIATMEMGLQRFAINSFSDSTPEELRKMAGFKLPISTEEPKDINQQML
ncbi:uncharacterized protein LOC109542375 [Dendroctonus ponderosae]